MSVLSRARFLRRWERVRDSLFYVPALVIAAALGLAVATILIDSRLSEEVRDLPFLLHPDLAAARATLTTAGAATITVAGIVFSVTVVAVQLSSSQFSPRVLEGFFRDRFRQIVIGLAVGAFAFDLVVVAAMEIPGESATVVRDLSVTVAVVLAIVVMLAIVGFIDRSLRGMRVGELVRTIAERTLHRMQAEEPDDGAAPEADTEAAPMPEGDSWVVRSGSDGWVGRIDRDAILAALEPGAVARLDVITGDFTASGNALVTVWSDGESQDDAEDRIRSAVLVGHSRGGDADPLFGVRQVVDIALRALSPGINDPTTANEVLLHLTGIVRVVLTSPQPRRVLHGADGRRLYMPRHRTRSDVVSDAFGEIRMAATSHPDVMLTLLDVLGGLAEHLAHEGFESRIGPLQHQARLAVRAVEQNGTLLPEDREPVRLRALALGLIDDEDDGGDGRGEPLVVE